MRMVRPRLLVVGIVGLFLLAAVGSTEAQMRPAGAEIVRAIGRVDVLPKGQSNWLAASVGARLVEGDQVRALAGGAADLSLPDGSTILVAENTRFAVTKLDYDGATRDRDASFHVVAGKVRAQVSQAAVQLVRARQSNFNISTPNGVAAVRGTIVIIAHNPATQETVTYVLPSPGQSPAAARVTFVNRQGQSVTITGNNFISQVAGQPLGTPTPIGNLSSTVQTALVTAENQATVGSQQLVVIQVTIPSAIDTQNLASIGGAGGTGGTVGFGGGTESLTGGGTFVGGTGACPGCGQDQKFNQDNTPQPPPAGPVCPPGTFGKPPNCTRCPSPPCGE
jgi:hypothetical protein